MIKDVPIKKNTYLGISFIGNNYNPNNFEDPEVFNPDRWERTDK